MAAFISAANLITYIETVINFQTSNDNFSGLSSDTQLDVVSLGDVDDLCSQHKTGLLVTLFPIIPIIAVVMTTFSYWTLVFLDFWSPKNAQERSSWTYMDPV